MNLSNSNGPIVQGDWRGGSSGGGYEGSVVVDTASVVVEAEDTVAGTVLMAVGRMGSSHGGRNGSGEGRGGNYYNCRRPRHQMAWVIWVPIRLIRSGF